MNITILIISYRSIKKLDQCLYNIGKKINVIIVENSDNKNLKKEIEKKYPNSKVILNNSNLGYSTAANIGIKEIKTKYVLLINTDILIKDYQVLELEKEIESTKEDFSLATPYHDDLEDFIMNNNFDKFLENIDIIQLKAKYLYHIKPNVYVISASNDQGNNLFIYYEYSSYY